MSVVKNVHVRWHHDSHENNDQVADIGEKDVKVGVEEPGLGGGRENLMTFGKYKMLVRWLIQTNN